MYYYTLSITQCVDVFIAYKTKKKSTKIEDEKNEKILTDLPHQLATTCVSLQYTLCLCVGVFTITVQEFTSVLKTKVCRCVYIVIVQVHNSFGGGGQYNCILENNSVWVSS